MLSAPTTGIGLATTAVLLVCVAFTPFPHAQSFDTIFLRVTDDVGAPIMDLQPEDVVIMEDDIPRETLVVERVDWPIKLQILIDDTSHMNRAFEELRQGLRDLLDRLPEDLPVELVAMSAQPRVLVAMTSNRETLTEGIRQIGPTGSRVSGFLEAIDGASVRIQRDSSSHFPVVLILAGNSQLFTPNAAAMESTMQRVFDRLGTHPATYHVSIWMDSAQRTRLSSTLDSQDTSVGINLEGRGSPGLLQALFGLGLTDETGGTYEEFAARTRLTTLLPEFGDQIALSHARQRSQYWVIYQRPPDAAAPRNIRAELFRDDAHGVISFDGRIP